MSWLTAWILWGFSAWPDDWPRFLGLNGDNTSQEIGLLDQFPKDGPPVIWSREVGAGYSAPSVREGTLVLHHRIGDREIVEAMGARSGKTLWTHDYASGFSDPYGYNNGPRATPLLAQARCYTFGAEGRLLCLDLASGERLWERDTQAEWDVPEAFFGVGSTPRLSDGRLFVMIGGMPDSGVVAFDAQTGRTLWEAVGKSTWDGALKTGWPGTPEVVWDREDKQASYASPVVATIHERTHLLCFTRQGLVSLDPRDGSLNFAYWFRSRVPQSVNAMTPVVKGDLILISAAYYRLGSVLLRVAPDGRSVTPVWRSLALEVHWNTPVLDDGTLFAFSGRNEPQARFRAVEFDSGKLLWDRDESWRRTTLQPSVYGRGSAILAEGKLIVLGEGGLLGLFKADRNRPVEIARYQLPELHYPCWAAPVLAHKMLYLRSENRLVCLGFGRQDDGAPLR